MCAYRSLYTFIDFKLLQKSLAEMSKMSAEITADNDVDTGRAQEIDFDIKDYVDVFAEDYCRNLKQDMTSQVSFIERLE